MKGIFSGRLQFLKDIIVKIFFFGMGGAVKKIFFTSDPPQCLLDFYRKNDNFTPTKCLQVIQNTMGGSEVIVCAGSRMWTAVPKEEHAVTVLPLPCHKNRYCYGHLQSWLYKKQGGQTCLCQSVILIKRVRKREPIACSGIKMIYFLFWRCTCTGSFTYLHETGYALFPGQSALLLPV